MSKDTNDWLLEDLEKVEKQSLIQRYLQNPFSQALSKLPALFQASLAPRQPYAVENYQSEQYEPTPTREQDLYPHFADRIDPTLYYTIFFSHERF